MLIYTGTYAFITVHKRVKMIWTKLINVLIIYLSIHISFVFQLLIAEISLFEYDMRSDII